MSLAKSKKKSNKVRVFNSADEALKEYSPDFQSFINGPSRKSKCEEDPDQAIITDFTQDLLQKFSKNMK